MLPKKLKKCFLIGLLVVFLITTCLAENSTDNINDEESKETAIKNEESKEEISPDVPPLLHENPPERVEEKNDIAPPPNKDNTGMFY